MITKRQKQILEGVVQEYIKEAQPVSSQLIEKRCRLGICPATVRIEMQKLTDRGYLFQPHTSAGRVPTDKGYRLFVDDLLEKEISKISDLLEEELKEILGESDTFKWASRLTKFISKTSSAFVVSSLFEEDFLFKEGWEEVLKEPEFEDKGLTLDFAKLLEGFEKNIQELEPNSRTKIFIGQESSLEGAKDFSIILTKCLFPEKKEGVISILGPKRMPYQKNISLLNSIIKMLEEC